MMWVRFSVGFVGLVGFVALLAGCGATENQLRARAAFDLGCGKDQLTIVRIDDRTSGVQGCGQRATYVEQCAAGRENCTWVLNGDSKGSRAQSE